MVGVRFLYNNILLYLLKKKKILQQYLLVSIVSGEHPAAMHHGRASTSPRGGYLLSIYLIFFLYIHQNIRWYSTFPFFIKI